MAESISVSYDPSFSPPSGTRAKLCPVCNTELEDRRKKYHDECKPVGETSNTDTTLKSGGRARNKRPTKISDATQRGMNSIVGKLLYLITLWIAWNQLRGLGVPDQNGDIADSIAFTDDEAEVIGKPLTRIFLKTEQGRKLAPVLVDNEDAIDAIFAFYDWYKRSTTMLDEYRKQVIPTQATQVERMPRTTRQRNNRQETHERSVSSNGHARQVEENRSEGQGEWVGTGSEFIPPSPQDVIAEYGN